MQRNQLFKNMAIFCAGGLFVTAIVLAQTTTIETNLTNAIQYIQKIVFTDNGWNNWTTGVIIDGTAGSIELANGATVNNIKTDGNMSLTNETSLATSEAISGFVNTKLAGYLTTETDPIFLTHSWDYYTTWEADSKFLTWEIWSKNSNDIFYTGENVGIWTNSPSTKLEVNGHWKYCGDIALTNEKDRSVYVENASNYIEGSNLTLKSANGADGQIVEWAEDGLNGWDTIIYAGNGGAWDRNTDNSRWWDGGNIYINPWKSWDGESPMFDGENWNIILANERWKVWIWTSSPAYLVDIYKQIASNNPLLRIYQWHTSYDSSMQFKTNWWNEFTVWIDASDSDKFKISDNNIVGANDRFTIQADGNIGIWTSSPTTKLEVDWIIKTTPRSTASTCDTTNTEWGIYYDSDVNHFYGCDGSKRIQLDN